MSAETSTVTITSVPGVIETVVDAILKGQEATPPDNPKNRFDPKRKVGEPNKKYHNRVIRAFDVHVSDEVYESWPDHVKKWVDDSSKAMKIARDTNAKLEEVEVPDPAAYVAEGGTDTAKPKRNKIPDDLLGLSDEQKAKLAEARKLLAEVNSKKRAIANPDKARKTRESKPREVKPGFTADACRREVIKNPNITMDELKAIRDAAVPPSNLHDKTLYILLRSTKYVVDTAKTMGKWKEAA